MRILVSGLGGHMGAEVGRLALQGFRGASLIAGVDPCGAPDFSVPCSPDFDGADADADVVVDFSHHSATAALLRFVTAHGLPLVLATTGQTEEEKAQIRAAAAEIPVFLAANYSLGIAVLTELVQRALALYPDAEVEIVEQHHDRKLDAPSGTALSLFAAVKEVRPEARAVPGRSGMGKRQPEDVGIHAIRMGNIAGVHEVIIGTQNESLTLTHQAWSRGVFADGSLKAARFLAGKPAGLYDMKDLLREG